MKDSLQVVMTLFTRFKWRAPKAFSWLFMGMIVYGGAAFAESDEGDSLAKGTEAFRSGEYEMALLYFLQAEDDTPPPTLVYNIAVSYFRLGRLDDAEHRFTALSQLQQWQGLAFYNLGLIAEMRNNLTQAAEFFRLCQQHSDHQKLNLAAAKKRQKIAAAQSRGAADEGVKRAVGSPSSAAQKTTLQASQWLGLTSLTFGRDSNAANLADDVVRQQAKGEDDYLQLIAYGQKYYSGRPASGSKLFVLASLRQFDRFTALSNQTAGAGVVWERPLSQAATISGAQLLYMSMGGDPVATHAQLHWGVKRRLAQHAVGFTYYPSYFFGADDFAHIDGWRHRLDFDWQRQLNDFRLKARYRYEVNDRRDRQSDDRFVSYSPIQHGLLGELNWTATANLTLQAQLHYLQARYSGTNNLRDVTGLMKRARRSYTHWQYELAAKYKFNSSWLLSGNIGTYKRDDTFDIYSYDGTQAKATLEFRF